jgi:hypothetical protein
MIEHTEQQQQEYARFEVLMEEDDVRRMQPLLADLAPGNGEDFASYESKP